MANHGRGFEGVLFAVEYVSSCGYDEGGSRRERGLARGRTSCECDEFLLEPPENRRHLVILEL